MTIRVRKHNTQRARYQPYVVYIGRVKSIGKLYPNAFHELANQNHIWPGGTREEAIEKYRAWLIEATASSTSAQKQLLALAALHAEHGKLVLVCHCHPEACHGDVLKEFLEDMAEQHEIEELKVQYCTNDPCETEAIKMMCNDDGKRLPLCYTCAQAYEWGQASPDATIEDLE